VNSNLLPTTTTISKSQFQFYNKTTTSEQRPPVNNGHKFGIPRVVGVHRFWMCYLVLFSNVNANNKQLLSWIRINSILLNFFMHFHMSLLPSLAKYNASDDQVRESISSTFYEQLLNTKIPKAQTRLTAWMSFFAFLGSVCVKAARIMLMKLTPGFNFINILWAEWSYTDLTGALRRA